MRFDIPCGCKLCGCLCGSHSPTRLEDLCPRHALPVVARWIAGEVMALICILLLIACVAVWSVVLRVPAPARGWDPTPNNFSVSRGFSS